MSTIPLEKKDFGNRFFSGVAILAFSTFIVKIIGMFYKIPMMAYLGAEGMGYFNSAYEIYSIFFVISTTGIPVAISILVSQNATRNRLENIKKIYKISLIILALIGLTGTLLMGIFHRELAKMINNVAAAYSILTISPTVFMICVSSAIRGYFQGHQIMTPTAISQIIEAAGKLLLGLCFAIMAINQGRSVPEIAAFAIMGLSLGVAVSLLYLIFYKLFYRIKYEENPKDHFIEKTSNITKQLISIALPITISSTILSLTKLIDMTTILGRLNNIGYTETQANAVYGAYSTMAVSIYNLPSTIISAIALPLVPLLASAIEHSDKIKEREVISISLKMTGLLALPTGLGISVFSKQILELIFASQTKEVEYTAPLLSILGLSVFMSAMITVTNAILHSYKEVKKPILSMIIGMLIKLLLSFILIGNPQINIYGAPISTLISTTAIVCLNVYFIIKQSGRIISIYPLFGKSFIAATISITGGLLVYILLDKFLYSKLLIAITILFVAFIYIILILFLRAVSKNDILMLPKGERIVKLLTKMHII